MYVYFCDIYKLAHYRCDVLSLIIEKVHLQFQGRFQKCVAVGTESAAKLVGCLLNGLGGHDVALEVAFASSSLLPAANRLCAAFDKCCCVDK